MKKQKKKLELVEFAGRYVFVMCTYRKRRFRWRLYSYKVLDIYDTFSKFVDYRHNGLDAKSLANSFTKVSFRVEYKADSKPIKQIIASYPIDHISLKSIDDVEPVLNVIYNNLVTEDLRVIFSLDI